MALASRTEGYGLPADAELQVELPQPFTLWVLARAVEAHPGAAAGYLRTEPQPLAQWRLAAEPEPGEGRDLGADLPRHRCARPEPDAGVDRAPTQAPADPQAELGEGRVGRLPTVAPLLVAQACGQSQVPRRARSAPPTASLTQATTTWCSALRAPGSGWMPVTKRCVACGQSRTKQRKSSSRPGLGVGG